METWNERLVAAMKSKRLTQAELADITGLKQPSVYGWTTGKTKKLGASDALQACKALGISLEWLLYGGSSKRQIEASSGTSRESATVALLEWDASEVTRHAQGEEVGDASALAFFRPNFENAFALRVPDTAMESPDEPLRSLPMGYYAIMSHGAETGGKDPVLAISKSNGQLVIRMRIGKKLVPLNNDQYVDITDFEVVGTVRYAAKVL